jgi:hypothetical protein
MEQRSSERSFGGGRAVAAVVAAFVSALSASTLWAATAVGQDTTTLKDALLRNQAELEAALYETTDGARVFVLDRTREPPLLKFQDSFEVLALSRVPASRGDEILRTDTGEDLVRVTALGAVTLYPRERPTGMPATRLGPAEPLPTLAATNPSMVDAFRALNAHAGEAEVDAPVAPANAGSANALLADAVRLTAEGLRASAAAPDGEGKLARLTRIEFVYGAGANARVAEGVLSVQLDESLGYAGRPSSMKVTDAVLGGG